MKRCLVGMGLLFAYCWSATAQDAAMFRGDLRHSGVYSTGGTAKLQKERWRFKTGNVNRSTPVDRGGTVYVGSQTSILYALQTASGNLKWEFPTPSEITSSPAVAEGLVFFGSRDGYLYAVDAATGQKKWAFSHEGSWCISTPAVWEGLVFAGSSDGMFVNAVDERTGQEKWRTKTSARVFTSGAIAAGNVYFGTWGGEVNWYDASSGKQVGATMAEAAVNASPVIADGVLYFGSDDGYIYAVELPAPRHTMTAPRDPTLLQAYAGDFEFGSGSKITSLADSARHLSPSSSGTKPPRV